LQHKHSQAVFFSAIFLTSFTFTLFKIHYIINIGSDAIEVCIMKKITSFIIQQLRKMSGSKKIKIALKLSKTVREVRKAGRLATGF